jgi:hypothetical protein
MFRWYRNAANCYVYLSDVSTDNEPQFPQFFLKTPLCESRWFTLGWTLQEFLAPQSVKFFSQDWRCIGDKRSLELEIQQITKILVLALQGSPIYQFSVEERMLSAGKRETTIPEDKAYSLLGIFDICMPLIYGEGEERAFRRLQGEIKKRTTFRIPAAKDWDDRTQLSWAAQYGQDLVVKELLKTDIGAVDLKDRNGRTPLSFAAGFGHEAVVKLLLEDGKAGAGSKDNYYRTPLSWAV